MKKLIFLLFFLFIPLVNAQSCYDSDNGLNYYQAGYVKFDDTTYYDNCVNEKVLIEGYCEDGKFNAVTYYCPFLCEGGTCSFPKTLKEKEYVPTVSQFEITSTQQEWLLNPWFVNPALEFERWGNNEYVAESPDDWKWGYACYEWNDESASFPIDHCLVRSYKSGEGDYNVLIYGYSYNTDKIGVVKLVQGNVWGGQVPWHTPNKLPIIGKDIYIDSWYNVGPSEGFFVNYMFDIWLKDDSTGHLMVLDLMFARSVPLLRNWWDGHIFHYQADVCGSGGWYHCKFKLNPIIDDAISAARSQGIYFNRRTTYIYQAEILIELKDGYGMLDVGGLRLYSTEQTPTTVRYWAGGGCPILKAFDGNEFKEIEKLNIHSREGVDTVYSTSFRMKPFKENTYKIILQEKWYALWEGSHIDYITDSTGKECSLIKAIHSKLGDVTSLIKESDDERVEIKPGERIELEFTECSGNEFTLNIEGFNPWWHFVKLGSGYTSILAVLITLALLFAVIFVIRRLTR